MGEKSKNILGVDVGEKRIGLASADSAVRVASPIAPVMNDGATMAKFREILRAKYVDIVVFGLPRNSHGAETKQSDFSREFARKLREFLACDDDASEFAAIEFAFEDESLTSVKAENELRARKNFRESMLRDGTLDSEAAAIILTDFLEGEYGR